MADNISDDQIIQQCLIESDKINDAPGPRWMRRTFGIGYTRAKRLRKEVIKIINSKNINKPVVEFDQRDDGATLIGHMTGHIITADQLIEIANVDLRIWIPQHQRVKKWDVVTKNADGEPVITQAFGITITFRRDNNGALLASLFDDVLSKIRHYAPSYPKLSQVIPNSDGDYLYVVSIPDAHFGKLAWAEETGENYDVKIAQQLYDDAISMLAKMASGFNVARVLYVVGNDLLHVDTGANTTTAGTPQDVDGRWQKAYRAAFDSVINGIERLREIAPVDVIIQPGNHDRERAWLLGEGLGAWFRNASGVRVLNEPSPRRYYAIGRVLLGITHGDGEKLRDLPGIMADETGDRWTRARRREWLIGHFHRRRHLDAMPLADERGVLVRVLPSLSGADSWHVSKGYHGQRAAVGLAYRLDGLVVHDTTVALAEDERRERGVFVVDGEAG